MVTYWRVSTDLVGADAVAENAGSGYPCQHSCQCTQRRHFRPNAH